MKCEVSLGWFHLENAVIRNPMKLISVMITARIWSRGTDWRVNINTQIVKILKVGTRLLSFGSPSGADFDLNSW